VSDEFPGPLYRLCTDPECPDAYAYREPPVEHFHFFGCPAGGTHVWTTDVDFDQSDRLSSRYIPPAERWHCDHCGQKMPKDLEPDR